MAPRTNLEIVEFDTTDCSGVPLSVVTVELFIVKRVAPEELWNKI
jgi:hypothetical protein